MRSERAAGFLALTDADWARFLQANRITDGVNFWSPKPKPLKKDLNGSILVMMAKKNSPWPRQIIGYGRVRGYEEHTPEEAWSLYGHGNGAPDLPALRARLGRLGGAQAEGEDTKIGCTILDDVNWLSQPVSPRVLGIQVDDSVVRGKTVPAKAVQQITGDVTIGAGSRRTVVRAISRAIQDRQLEALSGSTTTWGKSSTAR